MSIPPKRPRGRPKLPPEQRKSRSGPSIPHALRSTARVETQVAPETKAQLDAWAAQEGSLRAVIEGLVRRRLGAE